MAATLQSGRASGTRAEQPPSRRLTPHRGLPGGRAALGGLLVALAALGLFVAATQRAGGHRATYVVADRTLPRGARLTADDLALRHGALADGLRARTLHDADAAVGAVLLAPVGAGDPLLRHQLSSGERTPVAPQLSFSISSDRALAGTVHIGDHLRVLVTYGQDADAPTRVAAPDVEVLDVRAASDQSLGSASSLVITVAVPRDRDATALARATVAGKITLLRLGRSGPTPEVTAARSAPHRHAGDAAPAGASKHGGS